jgi:hypothetical protein
MKKLMMVLCGMFAVVVIAHAQVAIDTTQQKEDQPPRALPQSTAQPPHYQDDIVQEKMNTDQVKVRVQDVPAPLRRTLQRDEYKGWQNSTIYHDKSTDRYSLEISDGTTTRTYRFDKKGNRIPDEDDN